VERGNWEGPYFGTPSEFLALWNSTYGYAVDASSAGMYGVVSAMAIAKAFEQAQSLDPEKVFSALMTLELHTFAGEFLWKGNHAQIRRLPYI